MKQCTRCNEVKGLEEFYRNSANIDGRHQACKACMRKYDAMRFKNDPKVRARHRAYQKTEAGKKSMEAARKRWREKNEVKRAAHVILGNAIRDGKVQKPETCGCCGATGRIEGHHENYEDPLSVEWLCPSCHKERHRGN